MVCLIHNLETKGMQDNIKKYIGAVRVTGGLTQPMNEQVAAEVPFEVRINGRPYVLLMASRGDARELGMGFCLSEGLTDSPDQVISLEPGQGELAGMGTAYWVDVALPPELARRAKARRAAPAATSCGLCGLESVDKLALDVKPFSGPDVSVDVELIHHLFAVMREHQPIYATTGGTHAACLATTDGEILAVREDVGRHNALDRAIGASVLAGHDLSGCLGLLSGRVSFEMILKAARVGLCLVGSISAPTALGVQLSERLNITLLGFGRRPRATVFTHPRRVLVDGRPLSAF